MTDKIFGVDPSKQVTPLQVRNALVNCFYEAHCLQTEFEEANEEVNKEYCSALVKKAFTDAGDSFESPTKEGVVGAMDKLAELSKDFRDQETIQKHYNKIMKLVNKL